MNLRKSINISLAKNDKDRKWLQEKLGINKTGLSLMISRNQANSKRLVELADIFGMKLSEFIALGED